MSLEGQRFYPGDSATPRQIAALASEYHRAADALATMGRRGEPLSMSPYRLLALHAVELYLNALLVQAGQSSGQIRSRHHDLGSRALELDSKLRLKKKTLQHLQAQPETREYIVSRYEPAPSGISQINRLAATLAEVAKKVTGMIEPSDK